MTTIAWTMTLRAIWKRPIGTTFGASSGAVVVAMFGNAAFEDSRAGSGIPFPALEDLKREIGDSAVIERYQTMAAYR